MLSKKKSMVTMVTDEFLENRIIVQKSVAIIGFIWLFWFQKCILLYIFVQVFLVMRFIRSHISFFRLGLTPTFKWFQINYNLYRVYQILFANSMVQFILTWLKKEGLALIFLSIFNSSSTKLVRLYPVSYSVLIIILYWGFKWLSIMNQCIIKRFIFYHPIQTC